jgi:hypothetical protein
MRGLIILAFEASIALGQTLDTQQTQKKPQPVASELQGTWKVDLRPTPDSKPYFQDFVVRKVNPDNTFEGTFYGAEVTQARINTQWGAVRIAFVTSDQSGPYHHSAVSRSQGLEGLTNSTGRDFLSYWSAVKP